MVLEQTLCSSRDLNPGECNASSFEVLVSGVSDATGQDIVVTMEVDGYSTPVPLFTGVVESATLQSDRTSRKIIAYDRLYYLKNEDMTDWFKAQFPTTTKTEYKGTWAASGRYLSSDVVVYSGTYYRYLCTESETVVVNNATVYVADALVGKNPVTILADQELAQYIQTVENYDPNEYGTITLKTLRDELLDEAGLTYASVSLPNDNLTVTYTGSVTFQALINAICQLEGCFGHIGADGVFEYIALTATEDYTGNVRSESTYSEYSTLTPTGITALSSDGVARGHYGSSGNEWIFSNPLITEANGQTAVGNLASSLTKFVYVPANVEAIFSLPCWVGTKISFGSISTYILSQRFTGAQLIRQSMSSQGARKRDNTQTIYDTVSYLQAQTEKIQKLVEQTASATDFALVSANGKNTVFYSASQPPTTGRVIDDLWFDTSADNKVYRWSGSAWVGTQFGNAAIGNLDAGKITTGQLSAARIDVADIFAQNVTATGTITGATLVGANVTATSGTIGGWTIDSTNGIYRTYNGTRTDIGQQTIQDITYSGGRLVPTSKIVAGIKFSATGKETSLNSEFLSFYYNNTTQGVTVSSKLASGLLDIASVDSSGTWRITLSSSIYIESANASGTTTASAMLYPGQIDVYRASATMTEVQIRNTQRIMSAQVSAAGNAGLYDSTNNSWIIYSAPSNADVTIPHKVNVNALIVNYSNASAAAVVQINTTGAYEASYYLKNGSRAGKLRIGADNTFGLYDMTNSAYVIYSGTNQSVYIPHTLSVTGNLGVNGDYILIGGTVATNSPYVQVSNNKNNVALSTTQTSAGLYHYASTGSSTAKWLIYIDQSGTVVANTSDIRYKDFRGYVQHEEALALLRNVLPINFVYKEDQRGIVQNGFSAQEIRDTLIHYGIGYRPYLIIENTSNDDAAPIYDLGTPETDDIIYSIDYSKLTPVLWKGWQIHDAEIEELKERITQLEARLAS